MVAARRHFQELWELWAAAEAAAAEAAAVAALQAQAQTKEAEAGSLLALCSAAVLAITMAARTRRQRRINSEFEFLPLASKKKSTCLANHAAAEWLSHIRALSTQTPTMVKRNTSEKRVAKSASTQDGKKKKKEPSQLSVGDVRFGTYIQKKHKQIQANLENAHARTITGDAINSLEMMTDHLLNSLVESGRNVMRYTKGTSFSHESAQAAAKMTLKGALKKAASEAGIEAVTKYAASFPPKSKAAAEPVAE